MTSRQKAIGKFEFNSFFLVAVSAVSGAAGYLYQIILGNILSVENYGSANVLISYISIASMIIQPISTLANRNIAIYKSEQKEDKLESFLAVVFEMVIVACMFILLLVFGAGILQKKNWESFLYAACFAVTLITNIVYNVLLYVVQGFKQFGKYGLVSLAYAVVKVAVVFLGSQYIHRLYIVMVSLSISNIICIILLLYPGKKDNIIRKYKRQNIMPWLSEILPFYGWTFLIQVLLSFIANGGDVILVKYAFSDEMSGIYAVASNLCRIAMIGVSPIITIMFTETAGCLGDKVQLRKLLLKGLLYCSVIAGGGFLLLNILGKWVVMFLYGARYGDAVLFFGIASFYTMGAIWQNVTCQYCIALGKIKMMAILMLINIPAIVLASFVAATMQELLAACGGIVMVTTFIAIVKVRKDLK